MLHIRRSQERGHADHGWLDSRHSFSFAGYVDPRHMGFGHLRVINQDKIAAGRGFPTHSHRNMEIVTVVTRGQLEHRDTLGTGSVIRPGEVQVMSAGAGIAHSEFNHSAEEPLELLQIWLLPSEGGGQPGYQQRDFGAESGLRLVVSPEGRDGSLTIKQNADLWRLRLEEGGVAKHELARSRAWVQVIEGTLDVNGARLFPGDGLAMTDVSELSFAAHEGDSHALVFDLV